MGQFKPMVKMMTTEPTVELKLKKGGKVEKKMQMGGALAPTATAMPASMPARGGALTGAAPARPSLAARRRLMRSMPTAAAPAAPIGRAAAVMKEGGETKMEHKAEMMEMKGIKKELKSHEGKPASKAHKGLKTGGVVKGQGGYATGGVVNGQGGYKKGGKVKMAKGGIINTENQGGEYRNTKMDTAKPDHSPAKTGGVKLGNGGGYKEGGALKGHGAVSDYERKMMEGKKKGGAAKKYAEGGAVNDSGKAERMPQGHKKPSAPVSITQLSGAFKKGGSVTPAEGRLQKAFEVENAPAMRAAKAQSNEVYSKYQTEKKRGGRC